MTSNQDTINHDNQPTMTDYSGMSPDELIALLEEQKAENAQLKLNQKKTKRKKPKKEQMPPVLYEDHLLVKKPYFVPSKISKEDKPAVCEMLSSFGLDEATIKALIKTGKKTTVSLWLTKDYTKGVESQRLTIHAEEWGDYKKLFEGGSSTTNLTEGLVGDFPQEHPFNEVYDLLRPDDPTAWDDEGFSEDLYQALTERDCSIPTAKAIQSAILLRSYGKDYRDKIVEDFLFGKTPELPAFQYTLDALLLKDQEEIKRKSRKNGEFVGTTNSTMGGKYPNGVDLTQKKYRLELKYHTEPSERCLCLLEKNGKQRCGFKASFKLTSGMMFCSSHAGNILQTNYLLEKQGTPDDTYEHGVRAGWCENNCDAHDCECEKTSKEQLKKFKDTYSLLTQEEKAHYKTLKDRNKTNYGELFKDYAM